MKFIIQFTGNIIHIMIILIPIKNQEYILPGIFYISWNKPIIRIINSSKYFKFILIQFTGRFSIYRFTKNTTCKIIFCLNSNLAKNNLRNSPDSHKSLRVPNTGFNFNRSFPVKIEHNPRLIRHIL